MACQYFAPCQHGAGSFTIAIPKVTFGRRTLAEVGPRAKQLKLSNVALFTDPYLAQGPYVASIRQPLRESNRVDLENIYQDAVSYW